MTNLWVTVVLSGEWGHCHRGAECGGARVFTASDHNKSSSLRRVLTPIEAVKVRAGRAAPSALLLLLVAAYYPQCSYETSSPDKTHGSLPAPARRPAPARQRRIAAYITFNRVNGRVLYLYSLLYIKFATSYIKPQISSLASLQCFQLTCYLNYAPEYKM